tara:strand:- start:509 stop:790 length:282 start_codon:yes stop_codon:yes gene_type:complete
MLTKLEKEKLCSKLYVAGHLQFFCQRWSNDPDCPQHFEDMMRRFLDIGFKEQKKYYIIDGELYTVDQVVEKYQLFNANNSRYSGRTRGWYKTN